MRPVAASLMMLVIGACRSSSGSGLEGHLEARWTGADTGVLSAPATAEWCEDRRVLEIRAIGGDTGVALAVFPSVIASADSFVVPAPTDTVVPSARVALRWLAPTALKGFQGDSGTVVLERADSGDLTGSFQARARSVINADRIMLTGRFRSLAIVNATRGCAPDSLPEDENQEPEFDDTLGVD